MKYPLDLKIQMAKRRISEAVNTYGASNCYVGFSGGKDSTILSHLILSMGYKIEHTFSNTRLEYPECIEFANKWCRKNKIKLNMVMPEVMPEKLWKNYVYPMFSKETADILERVRNKGDVNQKKLDRIKTFLKYKNVKISAKCCDLLKKEPMKKWAKEAGKKVAILGTRAEESQVRRTVWVRKGCIYANKERVVVTPIIFFTEKDISDYAKRYKLKFADIYYKGLKRNGCYCCGFGCHMTDENNFVKLKRLNPALWKNVMDKWGFRKVCKQCNTRIE
jgi:3'-phosphoadenosine 5'-phosphosulfate sulfotransferase (PAPS reductase)/FAD synthetase